MELKNLFSKFTSAEKKKDYFLALEIASGYAWATVWQMVKGEVKIISFGTKEEWDGKSLSSLISASDASLAIALEDLPEEPNKVVFGLPETWISESKVVPPRLTDLKNLCQKLDLKPLGFVVTTEAIIQYLKKMEGTPLSAILIHLGKEEISLTLTRLGKNLGTQAVSRSEDFAADVYEGLARFGRNEPFPSRILLYDTELEAEKQALLSYNWDASLFLHFPKVETLDKKITMTAVTIAGGEEVGKFLGLKEQPSAEEFGFHEGVDVLEKKSKSPEKAAGRPKFRLPKVKIPHFEIPKIKIKIPHFEIPKKKSFLFIAGILAFLFFILGGGAIAFWWYTPRAQITIFVKPKNLEKEVEIGVSPNLTIIDSAKKQIPGEKITVEIKESKEKDTTGRKLIGDKAKGEVTVYNFTSDAKSFKKGTVIVDANKKEFTLDIGVMVASASSSFDENWRRVITPGKTKVAVTASKIGPEYNLASGSEFSIKGFSPSSYRAKNEKAFSGGTSRKVRVVAEADQKGLLTELTAELKKKVKEEISKKIPEGKNFLENDLVINQTSKNFDQAVGTEAEKLKLELGIKAETLIYSSSDLKNLLQEVISDSIPPHFILKEINPEIKESKMEGETAILKIHLKVDLLPDIDVKEIKKNLLGKYPKVAEEYFRSLPNFVKTEVKITPSYFPARLRTFPRLSKNIEVEVKVEE